jgi:protein TonB
MEAAMFDAIGVSERTRKPWTVAVSTLGQLAVIGLAVLVPLIGTDALPHHFFATTLPEPPRGLPHRAPRAAPAKTSTVVPPQFTKTGLVMPTAIPRKAATIQVIDLAPSLTEGGGVAGGLGTPGGSGDSLIEGLLATAGKAPPPMQVAKPPAPPAPLKRIQVGGKVQESRLISGPQPVYPKLAIAARVSGTVRLEAVISREGTIINLRAVSGHPLLVPAAVAAVRQWVFRPTYLNGDPVEVATVIDVNFNLR